jgi:phosphonate transport system substrate-binding protein
MHASRFKFGTNSPMKTHMTWRIPQNLILLLALLPAIWACEQTQQAEYRPQFADAPVNSGEVVYRFGVHPLHNPQRLSEVFAPLMDYLSEQVTGVRFQLEASRNYPSYDAKLARRAHHFSLPNPYQTLQAVKAGYQVFAKMGDDENFRGIILVRRDSGIEHPSDLKGKAVSYPAPTALAATMMPQFFLQNNGVDVMEDLDNRYVGSQESSVMNVFLRQTAAASTWPPPWRALKAERPELAEQLEVKWQTAPLINNGLVVLPEVPGEIVDQVQRLLVELHLSERGREILSPMELSRFEAADNRTYAIVEDFLEQFHHQVRPLP